MSNDGGRDRCDSISALQQHNQKQGGFNDFNKPAFTSPMGLSPDVMAHPLTMNQQIQQFFMTNPQA